MSIFKITNVTHLLGKREYKTNSILDIEYVDGLMKKIIKIKPNETIYLTTNSLPLSVHRLRLNNLVIVSEVSEPELAKVVVESKSKTIEKKLDANDDGKKTTKKINKRK